MTKLNGEQRNPDLFKIVARLKAWMWLRDFPLSDLRKCGIDLADVRRLLEQAADLGRCDERLLRHIANSIMIDDAYYWTGRAPSQLDSTDQMLLKTAEVYHQFISQALLTSKAAYGKLKSFFDDEMALLRSRISMSHVAMNKLDTPETVTEVHARFDQWVARRGNE